MKISNETKVGALAAVAITILILGYNFLAGNSLFSSERIFYAEYSNISGLNTSDDVLLRGLKIGKVTSIDLKADSIIVIVVAFVVEEDIVIPEDSEARIVSSDLLGAKALELVLGNSKVPAKDGSYLVGNVEPSLQQQVTVELLPVKTKFEELIKNIDSVIITIQSTFDTRFQENIDENMVSIGDALQNVKSTSERLDLIVERESHKIDDIFNNIRSITTNLNENEENINRIIANITTISDSLAVVNFAETMGKVNKAVTDFALIIEKANSGEGNLALLINQRDIYDNLAEASKSLDLLVEDIRRNPRRYLPPLVRIGGGKVDDTPEDKK